MTALNATCTKCVRTGWSASNPCSWSSSPTFSNGVAVSGVYVYCVSAFGFDQVAGITFSGVGLEGTIPSGLTAANFPALAIFNIGDPPATVTSFTRNTMSGTIPDLASGAGAQLQYFDVSHNQFTGSVPAFSGTANSKLSFVNLQQNNFTGSIPASYGTLTKLASLSFAENLMSGTIPAGISACSKLASLSFGKKVATVFSLDSVLADAYNSNSFSGTLPSEYGQLRLLQSLSFHGLSLMSGSIPSTWCQLSKLQNFDVQDLQLTGTVPSCFTNLTSMYAFNIGQTQITGSLSFITSMPILGVLIAALTDIQPPFPDISSLSQMKAMVLNEMPALNGVAFPSGWASLSNLEIVVIYGNSMTGSLPASYSALTKLTTWIAYSNSISGSVPSSWSSLVNLQYFYMSQNSLSGSFPSAIWRIPKLISMSVFNNQFSGTVSNDEFDYCKNHSLLIIKGNSFSGTIPNPKNCSKLTYFTVGNNNWDTTGGFPTAICQVATLTNLAFGNVNFNGAALPTCLGSMPALESVDFSAASFSGTIPVEWGSIPALKTLILTRNSLTGGVPSTFGNLKNLVQLDVSENSLDQAITSLMFILKSLPALSIIRINNNKLSGPLSEIALLASGGALGSSAFPSLIDLNFADNKVTNKLPSALGALSVIASLDARNNDLTGTIPESLGFLNVIRMTGNPEMSSSRGIPTFAKSEADTAVLESDKNLLCPSLSGNQKSIILEVDSSYYSYTGCDCNDGYYGEGASCSSCMDNAKCKTSLLTVKRNYWPEGNSSSPDAILGCQEIRLGETSCNPDEAYPYECAEGYSDRLCTRCEKTFYSNGAACTQCPAWYLTVGAFFFLFVLILGIFVFFMARVERIMDSATHFVSFFFYTQTVSILLNSTAFIWTTELLWLDYVFGWTNIEFSVVTCLIDLGDFDRLIAAILVPIFICFMTVFVVVCGFPIVMVYVTLMKYAASYEFRKRIGGTSGPTQYGHSLYKLVGSAIHAAGFLINLFYLPVSVKILEIYFCVPNGDPLSSSTRWYLASLPYVECSTSSNWIYAVILATPFTLLYVVGIPVGLSLTILLAKKRLSHWRARRMFGFVWESYKRESYYFELVIILRDIFLAFAVSTLTNSQLESWQPLAIFVVLLFVEALEIHSRPYNRFWTNFCDTVSMLLILSTLVAGLSNSSSILTRGKAELGVLLFVLHVLMILVFLISVVMILIQPEITKMLIYFCDQIEDRVSPGSHIAIDVLRLRYYLIRTLHNKHYISYTDQSDFDLTKDFRSPSDVNLIAQWQERMKPHLKSDVGETYDLRASIGTEEDFDPEGAAKYAITDSHPTELDTSESVLLNHEVDSLGMEQPTEETVEIPTNLPNAVPESVDDLMAELEK